MANMDTWGVTDKGFYRPTIDDIFEAKKELAKTIFGDDFDTDETTPEGMFFRINAAAESKLCEMIEGVYYSIFPHTATGINLDRVCKFANLTRDSAGHAQHRIKVYGTMGYIVEAGTLFKNADGVEFYSVAAETIEWHSYVDMSIGGSADTSYSETSAELIVQCVQSGEIGNVNDINATVEVNNDITRVQYIDIEAYGTPEESDPELRDKFGDVIRGLGTNTNNAIIANVLRVAGVNDVILIDNTTYEEQEITSSFVVPAKTYAVIVYSSSVTNGDEIAQAIFERQPLGIPQYGKNEASATDDSDTKHPVKFTYVDTKTVEVEVSCKVDSTFRSDGIKAIQDNIATYINGLSIGQEVIYTKLYDYIYNVPGVKKVTSLTLDGSTSDIPVDAITIARTKDDNIQVTTED